MTKQIFKRGFTLIELLVVIAIIGILASVVLASLNSARQKGSDTAVKANLANMRAQAELFYDNQDPNGYGDTFSFANCSTAAAGTMFVDDDTIANAIDAAGDAGNGDVECAAGGSGSEATSWSISTGFKGTADDTGSWCVDYKGFSGTARASGGGAAEAVCDETP